MFMLLLAETGSQQARLALHGALLSCLLHAQVSAFSPACGR